MRGRVEDRDHPTPQVGDLAFGDHFQGFGLSTGDPESADLSCGEVLEDLTHPDQVELPVVESIQGNPDESVGPTRPEVGPSFRRNRQAGEPSAASSRSAGRPERPTRRAACLQVAAVIATTPPRRLRPLLERGLRCSRGGALRTCGEKSPQPAGPRSARGMEADMSATIHECRSSVQRRDCLPCRDQGRRLDRGCGHQR